MPNPLIEQFALKWCDRLADPSQSNADLARDTTFYIYCTAYGFAMDFGQAFCDAYGEQTYADPLALAEKIDKVRDVGLMGSAAASRWKQFVRIAQRGDETQCAAVRQWFCLLLKQMAACTADTADNFAPFTGHANAMRLLMVESGRVTQWIELLENGDAQYSGHASTITRWQLHPAEAKSLLRFVGDTFTHASWKPCEVPFSGWTLTLTNTRGKRFDFAGTASPTDAEICYVFNQLRSRLTTEWKQRGQW